MKKIIVAAILLIFGSLSLTACGSDPMVVQETKTGMNLEDKARELTGQQGEDSEGADQALEKTPE